MQQLEAVVGYMQHHGWDLKPSAWKKKTHIKCMHKRSYVCKGHLQTEKRTLKHIRVSDGRSGRGRLRGINEKKERKRAHAGE